MPALAIWTPEDGLLGAVAPLGLAASAGTALVVDLDPGGPRYPGAGSLAELVAEGPTRADLGPSRRGLAVLRNGGVDPETAAEVVTAVIEGWPNVVLRHPARPEPRSMPAPVVPVRGLFPGDLFGPHRSPCVYQRAAWRVAVPGPGPVLPRPRPLTWGALLAGRLPMPDRWIRAWRQVWRWPWG